MSTSMGNNANGLGSLRSRVIAETSRGPRRATAPNDMDENFMMRERGLMYDEESLQRERLGDCCQPVERMTIDLEDLKRTYRAEEPEVGSKKQLELMCKFEVDDDLSKN